MRRRTLLHLAGLTGAGVAAALAGTAVPSQAADVGFRPGRRRLVVAADGSGDHTTVQAAIDAVPSGNTERFVIGVRPGTYLGQVIVPAGKPFVELTGLGRRPHDVVIADDRANGTPKPGGGTW